MPPGAKRGEWVPDEDEEEEAVARRPPAFFPFVSFSCPAGLFVFILARTFINSGWCNSVSRIFL